MMEILYSNEMKTLDDREKRAAPECTGQCIQKGERSVLDFIVIENGNGKETGFTCMRSGRRKY